MAARKSIPSLAFVTSTLVCCPLAAAQSVPPEEALSLLYGDEENVSIATGSTKPLHLAPAVASVVTAEEIRTFGATTLDEALEMVPGLHIGASPLNRMNPTWSIRGIHTDQNPQVLLLRNGIPITHFYTGSRPNLFRLPVSDIERIEVIRGPGSAVYGADAFAGVINVITRTQSGIDGVETGARAGSFERRDAWLRAGTTTGEWRVGFNLALMHSDGDSDRVVRRDLQTVFDEQLGTNASYAPGALSTNYDLIDTSLNVSRGPLDLHLWHWQIRDAGVGAGASQVLDPAGEQSVDLTLFDARYRLGEFAEGWSSDIRLSHYQLHDRPKFTLFPAGATLPVGEDGNIGTQPTAGLVTFTQGALARPENLDRYSAAELTTLYTGQLGHRWRLGLGVKRQAEETNERKNFGPGVLTGSEGEVDGSLTNVSDTPYVFMADQDRTVRYISLQDEWKFAPDWELTAGLRFDDYSDFGSTTNPRLALVWATRHDLTTKFLYGRAFRAPSFGEQYAQNNPVALGNPHLAPETIDTYELALDYRPRFDISTLFNVFYYEIDDLIDFVPDADGTTSTAQNVHDRKGHGFELEANWAVKPNLDLRGYYAWQHSEDRDTGNVVPNTPEQSAYLSATWQPLDRWSVAGQLSWVGEQPRAAGDPRAAVADYTTVNMTVRREALANGWSVAGTVYNLFDEQGYAPTLYSPGMTGGSTIPDDYPLPGRSMWLELSYRY